MNGPARPIAVGLVRADISGHRVHEHTTRIAQRAAQLGYVLVHIVHPPAHEADPVGYTAGIAAGLEAAALIVWDLETVGHTPSRVCDLMDLETVVPPATWAKAAPALRGPDHAVPAPPLTVVAAQRIMQRHRECRAPLCPRKAAAYTVLVQEGKIVPSALSPRERARARGLRYPVRGNYSFPEGVDVGTLLAVLDALAKDPALDGNRNAARPDTVPR
ncbi:MAG: hypothetical protein J2P18_13170 [Nocardia sp.]|nr:hypothetical protein [Nocardia sp.]